MLDIITHIYYTIIVQRKSGQYRERRPHERNEHDRNSEVDFRP